MKMFIVEPVMYLLKISFVRKSAHQIRSPANKRDVSAVKRNELLNRIDIPMISGMWLHIQNMWIGVM